MDAVFKYRLFIILLLMWLSSPGYTQELIKTPLTEQDSVRTPVISRGVDFISFPDIAITPELYKPNQWIELQVPAFDINLFLRKNRDARSWNYEVSNFLPATGFPFLNHSITSPFFHSGSVFHQATYQFGEKFAIGGNSFGMNSIFTPPPLNPSSNQWDVRGASMFMQYKVNRNFKIETRISVTGNQYHP